MEKKEEIVLAADICNLSALNEWIDALVAEADISPRVQMKISLAVEEIFANIASYAYAPQKGEVTIVGTVTDVPAELELVFMDEGKPFDPLARDDPPTDAAMEERGIGGLGIFLVKESMDKVTYRYEQGKNILTICKRIAS